MKNPPLRDMVTLFPDGNNSWVAPSYAGQGAIRPSGWTVVRVKLDNPGIWMLHCHIAWHLAMDMFGFIVTEPAAVRSPSLPSRFCSESPNGPLTHGFELPIELDRPGAAQWLPTVFE